MSKDKPVVTTREVSEKSRKHYRYRGNTCVNCGHPLDLSDVYCSYCSQLNSTKPLSLKDFFGEFLTSIFTYDSRLRYTLKDLLFRPGIITRNYVEGQRLKYANPFRFFLSVSIIFFLLNGLVSTITDAESQFIQTTNKSDKTSISSIADQPLINYNFDEFNDSIVNEQKKTGLVRDTLTTTQDTLKTKTNDSITKEDLSDYIRYTEKELDTMSWFTGIGSRFKVYRNFYKQTEVANSAEALDSLNHNNTKFNKWLYSKNDTLAQIEEKPYPFINYMLTKIPFFLFFFAPVIALFFWLIYSKRKHNYMEHLVFIFHIFSFVFLALLIALLPDLLLGSDILSGILFGILGPFYFYKALRNFYKQNRLLTIIKFVFLNMIFWIGASLTAVLFFFVSAALY